MSRPWPGLEQAALATGALPQEEFFLQLILYFHQYVLLTFESSHEVILRIIAQSSVAI